MIGIIGALIGLIAIVSVVMLNPQQEPTNPEEDIYFWAQVEESRLIIYIENEGDEIVVLKRIVLPDYGVTTPLMELARIQPDTTLPYLLIQNDPVLCDEIASGESLLIRIVTEKGIYEN